MDTSGQVAEVGDGVLGAPVGFVDKTPDGRQVGGVVLGPQVVKFFLCLTEAHRQRHQLRLGAVVEVALDAPKGLGSGLESLGPRLLEAPNTGRGRAGAEHELHHPPVQVDDQPHRPWGDEEQHEAGHEHSDVGTEPRRFPAVVAGVEQSAEGAEPRWRSVTEQRRRDAQERLEPDA